MLPFYLRVTNKMPILRSYVSKMFGKVHCGEQQNACSRCKGIFLVAECFEGIFGVKGLLIQQEAA